MPKLPRCIELLCWSLLFAFTSTANFATPPGIVAETLCGGHKNGKPLLSWRVQLLPFLEYAELYNQFKLDEPWDTRKQLKLLGKMPSTFALLRVRLKNKGYTVYQGFRPRRHFLWSEGHAPRDRERGRDLLHDHVGRISVAVPWTKR